MERSAAVGRAIGQTPGVSRRKLGKTFNAPGECSNVSVSPSTKTRRTRKVPAPERSGREGTATLRRWHYLDNISSGCTTGGLRLPTGARLSPCVYSWTQNALLICANASSPPDGLPFDQGARLRPETGRLRPMKDLESILGIPERNNTPHGISATGHTGGLGYEHSSRIRWIGGGRVSFRRFGGDRGACAGG